MASAPNDDTEPISAVKAPNPAPASPAMPPRTRAGFTWVMVCVAAVILILLIVFIAQNTNSVQVSFFSMHGRFPLSVALLAAAAIGCVLTLAVGTVRILQLRRVVRSHSKDVVAAEAATAAAQAAALQTAQRPAGQSIDPEQSPAALPAQPSASAGTGDPSDPGDPGDTGYSRTKG
jgi:uncharacterized integral membrane protein